MISDIHSGKRSLDELYSSQLHPQDLPPLDETGSIPPPTESQFPSPENVAATLDETFIDSLNIFLLQSIGESLQHLLNGDFDKELQRHLESCKSILNPPNHLQFLRRVGEDLRSQKSFFEIIYESCPTHLPIPFSLSWIQNQPVRITVPNPALRTLIHGYFAASEYEDFYKALVQHVVKVLLIDSPELLEASHSIIFRQLNLEYHFTLNLMQIIFLFFPRIFIEVANNHPNHDFSQLLETIFLDYRFGICDPRFNGEIPGSTPLVESLIVGDVLSTFPSLLMQHPTLRKKIKSYLTFLIRHGISNSSPPLSDPIVLSISKLAAQILASAPDLSQESLLYNYVFDALQVLKIKNPQLVAKIQTITYFQQNNPLTEHATYQNFCLKKGNFPKLSPEGSFLLVDLLGLIQKAKGKRNFNLQHKETKDREHKWPFCYL